MILISDVHSNYIAIKEILEQLDRNEKIVHAGDVVGYNPFPNETIALFKQYNVISIAGNHDKAVLSGNFSNFNDDAKIAALWTRSQLNSESFAYLGSLNSSITVIDNNKKIAVHHGAPFDEDYYMYEESVSESLLQYDHADILVLGHTHVPYILKFGAKIICNPGSAGQPRDGDSRAAYVIVNTENIEIELKRVKYNIKEVSEKIENLKLPEFLGKRLFYGL
ncbi:MAG: metallophosphoesterase family protein [Thermoplasmata archaeon]